MKSSSFFSTTVLINRLGQLKKKEMFLNLKTYLFFKSILKKSK